MFKKNKILKYDPKLKILARNLRNNSTNAEIRLWKNLRNKQLRGYDFHRQKPIGNYIVDFFCNDLMLAIEIDGISHSEKLEKDIMRQKNLEKLNIKFLRFSEFEVLNDIDRIIIIIDEWINEFESTHPLPPLKRGEL